jgi:GNAT superfamily N-acetyltransferase
MQQLHEEHRVGLDSLRDVTVLLQRNRQAHPTAGLYEAADLQWWWAQRARATDALPQLFWFDESGRPEAAVIATQFEQRTQLDPLVMPEASPDFVAHVVRRGLDHASQSGIEMVGLEVARTDDVLREVLREHDFAIEEDGVVETWLDADARPDVSALPAGYRLCTREDTMHRPHHMMNAERNRPEPRLGEVSLYRPDLDLVVHDANDEVAAYGLFWFDSATGTGLVEPMRTDDAHQRRGLARHVLTAGVDRLARVGAKRIKICFEPGNPASSHLYLSAGFQPDRQTDVWSGPTRERAS